VKLRAFDSTQATVIAPDFVTIDTARDPFNVVARNLADIVACGIWLNPFRGIPQVSRIPDIDIVFIDEHHRVLQCIEQFEREAGSMTQVEADSALILSAGGIKRARIQLGDQLKFSDAVTGQLWAEQVAGLNGDESTAVADDANEIDAGVKDTPEIESAAPRHPAAVPEDWKPDQPEPEPTALKRMLGWVFGVKKPSADRRKGERRAIPGLVAYFWTGGSPKPYDVINISTEGFYLLTGERWTPGTRILVSLQIVNPRSQEVEAMISVQSKVVWHGSDGTGFAFDSEVGDQNRGFNVANAEELVQLQKFLNRIKK
jgi:PilZ domain